MLIGKYEFTEYQLGILWAISSYSEGRLILRHQENIFLDVINTAVEHTIYSQQTRTGLQYVLKFRFPISELEDIGYTNRNNGIRIAPEFAGFDFFRAYIELHSSIDLGRVKMRKSVCTRRRLRVYGNYYILEALNYFLIPYGIKEKKIQFINEKTTYLSYASTAEVWEIYNLFHSSPCNEEFWNKFRNVLEGA